MSASAIAAVKRMTVHGLVPFSADIQASSLKYSRSPGNRWLMVICVLIGIPLMPPSMAMKQSEQQGWLAAALPVKEEEEEQMWDRCILLP